MNLNRGRNGGDIYYYTTMYIYWTLHLVFFVLSLSNPNLDASFLEPFDWKKGSLSATLDPLYLDLLEVTLNSIYLQCTLGLVIEDPSKRKTLAIAITKIRRHV